MPEPRHTIVAILLAVGAGAAWAGWSDLTSKAEDAKRKGEEVHKLVPASMKKIVGAMCTAGDDNRKSAGQNEATNARSKVHDQLDAFHRATKEAIDGLDKVANDSKDSNHSTASSLVSGLKSRRDQLDEQTRSLVNGNPPVIDFIVKHSESARNDRRSRCTRKDLSIGGGSVSCLIESSDTCTVLEIAFDNNTSIGKARDRASRAKEAVESELKRSSPSSAVVKCKKVEARVDCFKLCPDIKDDGTYSESSPSWRERCS